MNPLRRHEPDPLGDALLLTGLVWGITLLQPCLARWLDPEAATGVCFAGATLLVLARCRRPTWRGAAKAAGAAAAGLLATLAFSPLLGLAGITAAPGPRSAVARVLLAPVFEELLYREHLFVALRARSGPVRAIAATSLLFALPHHAPGPTAGALAAGVALGAARHFTGSVAACVGLHAGLNLGGLLAAP